jgi:hypothetical protein
MLKRNRLTRLAGNLTGVGYRDEILLPVAVPFVQQHHLIFQQDNTQPHVARFCQDFLADHNTSVYTTSTVRTNKSEPQLICEKDLSPLSHWKLSGTMCHQPSHATRATCTSERKTNVRSMREIGMKSSGRLQFHLCNSIT